MTCKRIISIESDHPAIAGHFPGRSIVPGVLVLREVLETMRSAEPALTMVAGMPAAKFASPLKPGERLVIEVARTAPEQASFVCHVEGRLVASGAVEFMTESSLTERL